MRLNQLLIYLKKPGFILALILVIFFFKGVFFAEIFPIFAGQDEARHYSSIQYIAGSRLSKSDMTKRSIEKKESIREYNYSEEIIETGKATQYDIIRHKLFDTVNFGPGQAGLNEAEINSKKWQATHFYFPPDTAGKSLYHKFGAKIEKTFSGESILTRFYLIRIFSVILGVLAVFAAYFIAKNIGFSPKCSLILTAIVAFQPKFSTYSGNINYDALLIPTFFLFTLGGVLSLKNGLNWKNISLMVLPATVGFYTKGTALVLLAMFFILIAFNIYKTIRTKKINPRIAILSAAFLFLGTFFFINYNFLSLFSFEKNAPEVFSSLWQYFLESFTPGRVALATRTYWGILGWNSGILEKYLADLIWILTAVSATGIAIFLFSKKKFEYLPEKKYIVFLLIMVAALQFGIRYYDWKIFMITRGFDLGTPGRYFLPNLATHIILLFVGLGALMRKEKYFRYSLITGLVLMFSFSMYLMFNVIIPRYYL